MTHHQGNLFTNLVADSRFDRLRLRFRPFKSSDSSIVSPHLAKSHLVLFHLVTGFGTLGFGAISLAPAAIASPVFKAIAQAEIAQTQEAPDSVEQVSQGAVRAILEPGQATDGICGAEPGLIIERRGKPIFDGPVADKGRDDFLGLCRVSGLQVRDLDGDQEPEVLLNNYSGGAHCCSSTLIYYYDRATLSYKRIDQFWGNGGATLEDLDGDGKLEFVSRDDRFAYAFASYAASAYPIQIWRYAKGNIKDVTRLYPKQIYGDAYGLWQYYQRLKKEFPLPPADEAVNEAVGEGDGPENNENQINLNPVRAALAAYMADKYMLSQEDDGWKRLEQLYPWRDRPQFITALKEHLRETGYITGSFTKRIEFLEGSTYGNAGGRLLRGDRHRYLLNVQAGQDITLTVPQGKVRVQIFKPSGPRWAELKPGQRKLKRTLRETGDYRVEVTAIEESGYSMVVEIP